MAIYFLEQDGIELVQIKMNTNPCEINRGMVGKNGESKKSQGM
ncbi:MAG: hypothetical protein ONB44_00850 [candidate division KSB1 bacterium]|nr:hypothetical protein [candidate division KSB1 bacterium]MDZ7300667.1 hypothetical protein [candidate division KSB1 bacterium]